MAKQTKSDSNRKNALKSTGPKSANGRAVSSRNSLRHGVLSSNLILPNENREEFDQLISELHQEFGPQGLLEMSLVERIGIALWRQRRLVRVEAAEIVLRQGVSRRSAITEIKSSLGLDYLDTKVEKEWDGVSGFEANQSGEEILAYANLWLSALNSHIDPKELQQSYPSIYQELQDDANQNEYSDLLEYLNEEFDGLNDCLKFNYEHYFSRWQKSVIRDLVSAYKLSLALPRVPENMARYQSALDNELYKAIRALKDAQGWRAERRVNGATPVNESKDSLVESSEP